MKEEKAVGRAIGMIVLCLAGLLGVTLPILLVALRALW